MAAAPGKISEQASEQPSEPDLNAEPSLEPIPASSPESSVPKAILDQDWNLKLVYSIGYSLNQATKPSHFQLDWSRPLSKQTEVGIYIAQSSATYPDRIEFSSTGYEENREYQLTNLGTGVSVSYRTERLVSLIANIGLSRTTSDLRSVTTTAPVPPSLTPGPVDAEVWGLTYRVGMAYEKNWGHFALGTQLTYGSTSSTPEAAINDVALGLFFKVYKVEVQAPTN